MSSEEKVEDRKLELLTEEVTGKYMAAAEIINKALKILVTECKPEANIYDLCKMGDDYITAEIQKVYRRVERGIAFPTCISTDNLACHYSPLRCDEVLGDNAVVKIEMGCHVDGFIAVVAHTHVITGGPVIGRAADVLAAAYTAAEVAMRLVMPGKKKKDFTKAIEKVAAAYGCKIVEEFLSHQMKQIVLDGKKVMLGVSNADMEVDDALFENDEVYVVDIVTSTGNGELELLDERVTTVFKRAINKNYELRMATSKFLFNKICDKFGYMPFTIRELEDNSRQFLGLDECVKHELLHPLPLLYEQPGELVARIKFTMLLSSNTSRRLTTHTVQAFEPTKSIEDNEISGWLNMPVKQRKKRAKKVGVAPRE